METLAAISGKITQHRFFRNFILLVILFSALLVGLETYPAIAAPHRPLLHLLDLIVVYIFVIEIVMKIIAAWPRPVDFFRDPWNVFDFIIVTVCLLPLGDTHYVAVLRIARILRVLRMVSLFPKLQLLIGALLKSIPSMGYVIVLLSLLFFIYGVVGSFLFGQTDPVHFGNLHLSLITLFKILTLEGWTDILNVHLYAGETARGAPVEITSVWPLFYFISFILIGAMIIMNLFIGVIMNSMEESQRELEEKVDEIRNKGRAPEDLYRSIDRKLDDLKKEIESLKRMSRP